MSMALAAAGAEVLVVDIDLASADQTVDLIAGDGRISSSYPCDVSDAAQVDDLARRILDLPISILINNAGISTTSRRVHEIPVEEWDRVMAVNLRSAYLCTRAFVIRMLAAPSPVIINMSSIVGSVALSPNLLSQASYAASKAAIIGLTRQTAADYGADGLRANAIAPGWLHGHRPWVKARATGPILNHRRCCRGRSGRVPLSAVPEMHRRSPGWRSIWPATLLHS